MTNIATLTRLRARNIDLVVVLGSTSPRFCTAFRGKVFSISGTHPRWPALSTLPRGGAPFHPRCTKRYAAFVEEAATPDELARAVLGPAGRELLGKPPGEAQKAFAAGEKEKRRKAAARPAVPPPTLAAPRPGPEPAPGPTPAAEPVAPLEFPSTPEGVADAKQWLAEGFAAWPPSLTPDERAAVKDYQSDGTGFVAVNRLLRFDEPHPERGEAWVRGVAAGLTSAIGKATLPAPVQAFRGLGATPALAAEWRDALELGLVWRDRAFFSVGLARGVAKDFADEAKTGVPTIFEVVVPAGTYAAVPSLVTGRMTNELELVLPPGTSFAIMSIETVGGYQTVKARLIT